MHGFHYVNHQLAILMDTCVLVFGQTVFCSISYKIVMLLLSFGMVLLVSSAVVAAAKVPVV